MASILLHRNAVNPEPSSGSTLTSSLITLAWEPGDEATSHNVYLSTNEEDVVNIDASALIATTTESRLLIGVTGQPLPEGLVPGTTYYWRVDEFTPNGTIKGPVWSFTTIGEIPVEDDSLLGWWNMDQVDNASILDMSGHGNHGAIQGKVEWVDGVADAAVVLTGDDLITIPPLDVTTDTLSMTGWIKPARVHGRTGIIFMRAGALTTGINLMPNNQLGYHWLDAPESWQYEFGLIAAVDEWAFVAMVVTPEKVTLYLNSVDTARELMRVHEPVTFSGELTLGSDMLGSARRYVGALDDLRFYNRALTTDDLAGVIGVGTRPPREVDPMVLEAFDSYNAYGGDGGQWVWDVWVDGLGGNGTGSILGYECEPIMSRDIVVGGGQALPLLYNNTGTFVDLDGNLASNLLGDIAFLQSGPRP